MLTLKKLLLPVDYSARCLSAADSVRALATGSEVEVTVLHVKDVEAQKRANPSILRSFGERLSGFRVHFVEVAGDPALRIIEYARTVGTDLIVMPTRAYGFLDRLIMGSVTERVLRGVDCPVWTGALIEPSFGPWPRIASVACGVNLQPESVPVLRWAADFADDFGAQLTVVYAHPKLGAGSRAVQDSERRIQLAQAARKQLADLVAKAGVRAEIRLVPGRPSDALASAVQSLGADVLVIGRRGKGLAGRFRRNGFGVIRRTPCPVVSVDARIQPAEAVQGCRVGDSQEGVGGRIQAANSPTTARSGSARL